MWQNKIIKGMSIMFINESIYSWKHQLWQGILLALFGIFIVIFPQILVTMIASIFIFIGVIFVSSSLATRRFQKEYGRLKPGLFEIY